MGQGDRVLTRHDNRKIAIEYLVVERRACFRTLRSIQMYDLVEYAPFLFGRTIILLGKIYSNFETFRIS